MHVARGKRGAAATRAWVHMHIRKQVCLRVCARVYVKNLIGNMQIW